MHACLHMEKLLATRTTRRRNWLLCMRDLRKVRACRPPSNRCIYINMLHHVARWRSLAVAHDDDGAAAHFKSCSVQPRSLAEVAALDNLMSTMTDPALNDFFPATASLGYHRRQLKGVRGTTSFQTSVARSGSLRVGLKKEISAATGVASDTRNQYVGVASQS